MKTYWQFIKEAVIFKDDFEGTELNRGDAYDSSDMEEYAEKIKAIKDDNNYINSVEFDSNGIYIKVLNEFYIRYNYSGGLDAWVGLLYTHGFYGELEEISKMSIDEFYEAINNVINGDGINALRSRLGVDKYDL